MDKKIITNRYKNESAKKRGGETFTPIQLADFVAERLVKNSKSIDSKVINILEPSVGDGVLLLALLRKIKIKKTQKIHVTAYDVNAESISEAKRILFQEFPEVEANFLVEDFLLTYSDKNSVEGLFPVAKIDNKFDFVISNPPYVRTQILGALKANDISSRFGLTGRVDLYQPFLIAMISHLKEGGSLGAIVSNRFLTTKSGASTRKFLGERLEINEVWDLGDTKLFDAAVLPALIFGKRSNVNNEFETVFNSIYEVKSAAVGAGIDLFQALSNMDITDFACTNGKSYQVSRGTLKINPHKASETWAISNLDKSGWLATVKSNTAMVFGDIAKIKVGVKTTADKVFLKKDWEELGKGKPELLFPLLTRKNACRYRRTNKEIEVKLREILYPYDLNLNSRKPVDIKKYPKTNMYLEAHRATLEARTYVIEAGRQWYEIWVPHSPSSWKEKKLVFPDISEKPLFWLDTEGAIVSGECYWLTLESNVEEDLLYLILAIANSSFIEKFYDTSFNNKLYSGKRRFISQYVEKFPLPNPQEKKSKEIIKLVKQRLLEDDVEKNIKTEKKIDALVAEAFGL